MTMDLIKDLIVYIGSAVTITAGITWLAKVIIEKWITYKLELQKIKIESSKAVEIERLKFEQQKQIDEKKILLSRLHEKRSDVIAEVYEKMFDLINNVKGVFSVLETSDMPTKSERYNSLMKDLYEFRTLFGRKRLYFSEELSSKISKLVIEIISEATDFKVFVIDEKNSDNHKRLEVWINNWKKATETELPNIQNEIEKEFKMLIGID